MFRKSIGQVQVEKVSILFDILWIRIELGGERVFMAVAYMSPVTTTRDTDAAEFLMELENDILSFREQGKVVVMGDLNSRVGSLASNFFLNEENYEFPRISEDVKISKQARQQGKRVLESMNLNKMVIMNGVDGGGEFTCLNKNKGESVIDYIIMSYDLILKNPEVEREEEVERDYKHKQTKNNIINLQDNDEQILSNIIYKRQSIKVWTEHANVMSDHRLVTCDLIIPEKKVEKREKKKVVSEIKNNINNTQMEKRKGEHRLSLGKLSERNKGRTSKLGAESRGESRRNTERSQERREYSRRTGMCNK